jgi:hypothetical protein
VALPLSGLRLIGLSGLGHDLDLSLLRLIVLRDWPSLAAAPALASLLSADLRAVVPAALPNRLLVGDLALLAAD